MFDATPQGQGTSDNREPVLAYTGEGAKLSLPINMGLIDCWLDGGEEHLAEKLKGEALTTVTDHSVDRLSDAATG